MGVVGENEEVADEVAELVAEANAWRNEDPDDDQTEIVSERVTSLIGRLADALENAQTTIREDKRYMEGLEQVIAEAMAERLDHGAQGNGYAQLCDRIRAALSRARVPASISVVVGETKDAEPQK